MIKNKVVCGGPTLHVPAHMSIGEHILDRLRQNSKNENGIALINAEYDRKTSYKQLLQDTVNFAAGLQKIGVKPGDVVAIFSENRPEYYAVVFGAIYCGATVTALNSHYTEDETLHAVHLSRPVIIVSSKAVLEHNLSALKKVACIKTIIQLNGTAMDSVIVSYRKIMTDTNAWEFQPVQVQGWTDVAFILYSSGTTGMPKGVMLTHLNVLYLMASLDYGYTMENCSRSLMVVPWYHALGLMYTISHLINNKLTVFSHDFNMDIYLSHVQHYKIDFLIAAPPIVISLSKSPLVEKYDISSIKMIWCGGAPLGENITKEVLRRIPSCVSVKQLYGMTEVTCGVIRDLDNIKSIPKPGSCGYPIPGFKLKIIDVDTRLKLGPNTQGEICLKGPSLMKGYIQNESATRDIMDQEGYIKTGDIGYYDNDGCLFVIDRLKELIKYKGHQVSPAVVEKVILQHDGITECGVVGAPDELAGELPTAFVVRKIGSSITEEELLRFTAQRLSKSARLRGGVIFLEEIPKNKSGKIMRRELKRRLMGQINCKL